MKAINPATNEVIKTYQHHSADDVASAIEAAHQAFLSWRARTFSERKRVFLKFAKLLREQQTELAKLITQEMGKRIAESEYEIDYCARIAEFYAEGAEQFLADEPVPVAGAQARIQHAPIGVLFGVMPWNFPFYQVTRFASPNLMAGNTVIIRHSSIVPGCAEALAALLEASGLPLHAYTNLRVPTEAVDGIIGHPQIRGVSLTGSEGAGAAVASSAGKHIKRSVLELGGNDAFVVLDDANLEKAIEEAIKGRMVNTGQSCVAAKRFIVMRPLADAFLAGLREGMAALQVGNPLDRSVELGPLSSEEAVQRLEKQVNAAIAGGAKLALGGKRLPGSGTYFEPTILTGISPENPCFDEELFGPVAAVYVVDSQEEAIELANRSSYGLGGSVHSQNLKRAQEVAEQLDTGMVFINQTTTSQPELPFGGTKNSGYGRELSKLGIYEFINKKLIHHRTLDKN